LDELKALLEGLKPRPKTVLTNGVFDILHAGHASYLEAASNLGDILIVALNDDASALALKGKDRPVLKLEDRLRLVASFRWVDYVTWFPSSNWIVSLRRLGRISMPKEWITEGPAFLRPALPSL